MLTSSLQFGHYLSTLQIRPPGGESLTRRGKLDNPTASDLNLVIVLSIFFTVSDITVNGGCKAWSAGTGGLLC